MGGNRLDLIRIINFLYFEVNWQIRMCVLFACFGKKIYKIPTSAELIKLRRKVWEFDFNSEKKTTYLQRAERGNFKRRNSKLFLHSFWLAKIWYLQTCHFTQNIFFVFKRNNSTFWQVVPNSLYVIYFHLFKKWIGGKNNGGIGYVL